MSRTRGRRYDEEPKLNIKKVFGVIVAIAVIVMIIVSIVNLVKNSNSSTSVTTYTYYTAYEDGKFGVIDNDGNIIIEPTYDEMILIPDNSRAIFICIYDVNDEDGTYKTKVLNENNEEILTGYDTIEAIDNYDSKQNIWYEDNVLRVSKDGKYGLINFDGEEILSCDYDEITALESVTGNFIVKKDDKVGLVNDQGQTIISVEYSDILTLEEGYKNEYIIVNEDNEYGVISTIGTVLIEPQYEAVKYLGSSTLFAVKESGDWKIADTEDGTILLDEGYEDIVEVNSGYIIVMDSEGKYGVVTEENEQIIEPEYEDLEYAFSIYYIAEKDGKYGIINQENETVIDFEYLSMVYIESGGFIQADKTETESVVFDSNLSQKITGIISEINIDSGYLKVYEDDEYKYYNFKLEEKSSSDILTSNTLFLSKKDGKYGYVNKDGDVVVDYIYDDGTEQNSCGYAAVKIDGVWGSIDKAGVVSKEPSVDLDDSIYIDFIGEWHLSDNGLYYEK